MHHKGSSPGPGRAWGGAFMAFTEASSPGPFRAWRGGFMVFLFSALCYTICTMKAPPQALPNPQLAKVLATPMQHMGVAWH